MKKFFRGFKKILAIFVVWRAVQFVIAYVAQKYLPLNFSYPYIDTALQITNLPEWIWGWGGFDGVHYLRLAQNGYGDAYTQAFFPLYPLAVSLFSNIFSRVGGLDLMRYIDPAYFYSGLILSNIFALFFVFFFYKLLLFDFKKKQALYFIVLALLFPASYYLGAIYSESLFFLLCVISFYCSRHKNFLLAGFFAMLASATKVIGVFLFFALLLEIYQSNKGWKFDKKQILGLLMTPVGLITYMLYLWKSFLDPLLFLHVQPGFGAQRSASIFITLPQVFWRYFKMLTTVSLNSPQFFNALIEVVFALFVIYILIATYKKARKSYWLFALLACVAPTLTGTFSSMPRYALIVILLFPYLRDKILTSRLYLAISSVLLIIFTMLFLRGYWIA